MPPSAWGSFRTDHPERWFAWPEFLRAAHALEDTLWPCRIIMGAAHLRGADLQRVLSLLPTSSPPIPYRLCTPQEALFVKYATNAIHAVNVGLANELAEWGRSMGIDWNALVPPLAEGSDTLPSNIRVTEAGGFDGGCLPKDVAALVCRGGDGLPILMACHKANRERRPDAYA